MHRRYISRLLVSVKTILTSAHLEVICTHFCSATVPVTNIVTHKIMMDIHDAECVCVCVCVCVREREREKVISQTVVSVY